MIIGGISATQGGAAALIVLVVILILTGRLVPRSVVRDIRKDRDERVAEAQEQTAIWREAYQLSKQAQDIMLLQTRQQLEVGRTVNQVLQSLPTTAPAVTPVLPAPPRVSGGEGDPNASAVV